MSGHAHLIPLYKVNATWQKPKKIGYKTTAWRTADGWSIRLHHTNVCSYDAASQILFVSPGGQHSGITAQRIRHGLLEFGLRLLTHDLPGRWRVADFRGNAWTIRGNSIKLRMNKKHNTSDGNWLRVND